MSRRRPATMLIYILALTLSWVLATQDRVRIFEIDPCVDLPTMVSGFRKNLRNRRLKGNAAAVWRIIIPRTDAAHIRGLAPRGLTAAVVAIWRYLVPPLWRLNNPSTAPPRLTPRSN